MEVLESDTSSNDLLRIICTCAGHKKCAECSHQIAIAQLLQYFSIEEYVTTLQTVVRVGRPSHYQPAGFVAVQNPVINVKKTTSYVGSNIAWRFPDFHRTRIWTGKIVGRQPYLRNNVTMAVSIILARGKFCTNT